MRTIIFLMLVLSFGTLSAHHSGAEFDKDRVVVIEGTVVDYRWRNPHVYVVVNDSNDIDWMMETDATPIMQRSGWTRDSFVLGDAVTVRANPDRRPGKHHGLIRSITGSDGVSMTSMNLMRGTNVSNQAVGATTLAGVWTSDRFGAAGFWDSVKTHPLTPKGQAAKAAFDETMSPTTNCIAWPTPFLMAANSLYLNAVEIADDVVVIRSEFFDATRIIYVDGRGHPKNGELTNQGHSIGKWEGDTLVVDTTLFAEHRAPVPNTGIPSGIDKHVVERIRLSEDGKTVQIEMLIEDPEFLAEPQELSVTWHHAPHLEMLRVDCDPDVAQQFLQ